MNNRDVNEYARGAGVEIMFYALDLPKLETCGKPECGCVEAAAIQNAQAIEMMRPLFKSWPSMG